MATQYEAIIQTTDEFETKTESIYRTQDKSILPAYS